MEDAVNIIEVKNLSYSYDGGEGKQALDKLNMTIKKGSITAILGGNGAGKSTLFLNLNGVLQPSSGDFFYNGEKVTYNTRGIKELRKKVGIVFQDPNDQLFSDSVRNDISFGAINMGVPEKEVMELVEQVAQQTGVTQLLDRPTHALSFGQKKRVAIAGVLIMNPQVIILDEPTAGLDPDGVTQILHLLLSIKKTTGITVLVSTHDIDIVPLYCDFAYVIKNGKTVLSGTPKEIFAKPEKIRECSLRVPRIAHLMEILNRKDGIDVDITASTISSARATIKEQLKS